MSTLHIDDAAERMRQLAGGALAQRLQRANEAETRLLLIDEVLGILGWDKSEFKPEKPTSTGGYTDYRLTVDGQERLIVEAKRFGLIKPLPRSIQKATYRNSFLLNSCGNDMNLLLSQCKSYCTDCGIPYAVAATGDIWIVLIGFKFGVEWAGLSAYVFHSLSDLCSRFSEFYGLVSKEAIRSNSLEEKFGAFVARKPRFSIRPRESIVTRCEPQCLPERRMVESFFEHFMGDISKRHDMLEHCYVEDTRLNEFSRELQQLLEAEAALDEESSAAEAVDTVSLDREIELQISSGNPRTILLVGNVGAGKSTFINRFLSKQASSRKNIGVVLDLINQAAISVSHDREEEQQLSQSLLEELAHKFPGDKSDPFDALVLRGCFEIELGRFKQQRIALERTNPTEYGIREEEFLCELAKDRFRHLVGYLRYMSKKKYRSWITFDNVDRGSDSYQRFIYSYAHKLASNARCVTLITLREDTYIEARDAGFLDVRISDIVFRVKPPEFRQVIAKRRRYVEYLLRRDTVPRVFREHQDLLRALCAHIARVVLGDDDYIRALITTFSLGNIRYSLRMLRAYYSSFHSTFHEYYQQFRLNQLKRSTTTWDYEHERFLRGLMLSSAWSYREDHSEIFNLFAVDSAEQLSHFLLLRILAYLHINYQNVPRGTLPFSKLSADLVFLGHQRSHIDKAVRKLLYAGLLVSPQLYAGPTQETNVVVPDEFNGQISLAISAKGYYYLTKLCADRYYQTRVAEDNIWYNEELANKYIKCLNESIAAQSEYEDEDALAATDAREIFISYLRKSWLEETQKSIIRDTPLPWARGIKQIIERNIFGEQLSPTTIAAETERIDELEIGVDNSATAKVPPSLAKQIKPSSVGAQLKLFVEPDPLPQLDYERALKAAIVSLGYLPPDARHHNSTYVARVLWALELCSRAGLGAQRATDIASLLCDYASIHVEATNIARFLRMQKQKGEYAYCWKEDGPGYYVISKSGKDVLETIMIEMRARKPSHGGQPATM